MDELDKKILADIRTNCRMSYQEISRKYEISANAIRRRILNLEESGVIDGYTIILSPAMTNTEYVFGLLHTDGSRDEVEMVDEIGSSMNVVAAAAYTDGTYALVFEYHGSKELQEVSSFLRRIEGVEKAELHHIVGDSGKEMKLSKTHLRILKPLFEDPRLPIVEVAKRAGLTARRARRLIKELEDGGGLQFVTLIELGAASSVPFITSIQWDEKKHDCSDVLDWILKEYALQHWENYVSASEPVFYVLFVADDLTELTEIVRGIRKNKMVTHVKSMIGTYHKYFSSHRREKLIQLIDSSI
ncbi:MAG: winged helix-turn-helix transcriptional regulator [Candidatus Thorarchaeota archaeon]|jgi:Lrp/AsnC family leucine-responsive transcriptional regulator